MPRRSIRAVAIAALAFAASQAGPAALAQSSTVQEIVVRPGHLANPNAELRTATVAYADLDLNRDAGALVMLQRIRSAAKKVCEPEPTTLAERSAYRTCYNSALSDALSGLHNPRVSALYASGA